MNIKDKILTEIEKDNKNSLGIFAVKDEYLKIFSKMDSITKNLDNFKVYPDNFFEDFNYDIYKNDYNSARNSNVNIENILEEIPKDVNIIVSINGYFIKEYTKLVSSNLIAVSIADKINKNYYGIEKRFVKFYSEHENQLSILNSLLSRDGIYVNIASNTKIDKPIYLLNIIDKLDNNYFINSRKLINISSNSSADIVEIDLVYSQLDTLYSELFLLHLEDNSNVNYSKMFLTPQSNKLLNNKISYIKDCGYQIDRNANLNVNTITIGTNYNKNLSLAKLKDINSSFNHNFFALTNNDRIVDFNSTIYHNAPNTQSNQLIKVVANDNSKMFFDGKIIIDNNAENSAAIQNSKAILLSDDAIVNFQPQMEIYNEDIKATHGSAIGNLEEDLLFYLQSRGINNDIAKKLLLSAFALDIINQSSASDYLKEYAVNEIENAL